MASKLDLLLVNPGGQKAIYQSLSNELTAHEPPVWAGLMASFARTAGLSCAILDASVEGLSFEQTAERVAEANALLVAVVVYGHQPSASTQHMPAASGICRAIKQRDSKQTVLLLGGHVASLPKRTLEEEAADFVCGGEGLVTLVELVEALKSPQPRWDKVHDLLYRDNGSMYSTATAPLVTDLDQQMPGLAWDLLPMPRYRAHNWHCFGDRKRQPYAAIYTTLGCPYHCSFCCIQAPFKSAERASGIRESVNSYRFWSPDSVVAQIDRLVNEYGIRNIKIADEMFVLNPRHVLGICDLIIQRGYDLNIWAYARVDTVQDKMLDKLKAAGFNWLALGIEAADRAVRKDVDKDFPQEKVFATLDRIRSAGINVIGNYIFGLPEDSIQSMQATLDLALELNCEFANLYCAMAYPGSRLYELALKEGWTLPKTWSGYSQHARDSLPLRTRHLEAADVLRFRDQAFQTYFNSPKYLEMIGRKFGEETADEIRKMSAHKLERDLVPKGETNHG
ncbi:MAG: B12-binding domain-containing radical SAM protein [Verrucomicrobia bacterium]|nr:MAG: B12-binding domain-containing radical SAM protein [Verrucomicrobiota bacterium]